MFSGRYVDTPVDRARWRLTANARLMPRLQAGVELNPGVAEVNPLLTWFLVTETERRPALFLGTSSDRIGSPEGMQAYYVTIAKYLPWARTAPYLSVNYSEWDSGWNLPFGATLELPAGYSLRPMYDGQRTHLLAIYTSRNWSATALWAWLESAGVAFSIGF